MSITKKREDALRKILAEDFGIFSDEELIEAIRNMERVNLAIMQAPVKWMTKYDDITLSTLTGSVAT